MVLPLPGRSLKMVALAVGLLLGFPSITAETAQALPLGRGARWASVTGPVPATAYGAAVFHPSWEGYGYWGARPWDYGWYGMDPVAWAMAANVPSTAAIVKEVNASIVVQSPLVLVADTPFRLNYASVVALPKDRVSFRYLAAGVPAQAEGDCRRGLLNGVAATGPQAMLLHAACTVAYGSGS